jgi:hypothetical protein
LFDRVEDGDQDTTEEDTSALARMFALQPSDADDTDSDPDAQSDAQKVKDSTTAAELKKGGKIRQSSFEISEETDAAADLDKDDIPKSGRRTSEVMEIEDMEFREPLGAKMRRTFLSPFRSEPAK